jgi:hypothetical protein
MARRAKFTEPEEDEKEKKEGEEEDNDTKEGQKEESSVVQAMTSAKWPSAISPPAAQLQQRPSNAVQISVQGEFLLLYAVLCAVCFLMALFLPFRKLVFREIIVKVIIDEILAPVLGVLCSIGDRFPVVRDLFTSDGSFGFWILSGGMIFLAKWMWDNRNNFGLATGRKRS